jgi:predicted P-loop ATPase
MAGDSDDDPTKFWMRRLRYPQNGGDPWPTLSNCMVILSCDPVFVGSFGYNEFTHQRVLLKPPPVFEDAPALPGPFPRPWEAEDVSLVMAYLERSWGRKWARATVMEAMHAVARAITYHPILNWLDTLEWDGKKRIDTWLINVFDARNEFPPGSKEWKAKDAYHRAVGARFLIAAVRRMRVPGTKFDHLLILEGMQRIGKSTAAATLFGAPWFSDNVPPDLKHKDAALALHGLWCLEFSEIEHLVRTEIETIKAFLSRSTDHFRPPYGREFIDVPRANVFLGTTNSDDYLRDSTGNTRMWPVYCQSVDLAWLEIWRSQLWAEAVERERKGEVLWLDNEDTQGAAAKVTTNRLAGEVWEPAIVRWLTNPETVIDEANGHHLTTARVLEHALGMSKDKMTRAAEMRVGPVLRSLGYERKIGSLHGKAIRVWRMPDDLVGGSSPEDGRDDESESPIGFG